MFSQQSLSKFLSTDICMYNIYIVYDVCIIPVDTIISEELGCLHFQDTLKGGGNR
jgi:hypothetical protein